MELWFDTHAIVEAMMREVSAASLRQGLKSAVPPVQRAALIALAEREASDLKSEEATSFLLSEDAETRRIAEWVIRRR